MCIVFGISNIFSSRTIHFFVRRHSPKGTLGTLGTVEVERVPKCLQQCLGGTVEVEKKALGIDVNANTPSGESNARHVTVANAK